MSTIIKQEFNLGTISTSQFILQRPRVGWFEFWLKDHSDSVWSKSTDPLVATVNGVPMGWRIFFDVPAPGGGGIE